MSMARMFTILGAIVLAALGIASAQAGDRALGEYLSAECVTCHQLSGDYAGIPPIVAWPESSFIEILNEYRTRARPNPTMQTIAGRLTDEEVAALAAYFGGLTLPKR
jgi:cytochrome c553